jgi:N-acetylmuramoyl-L-alanine amidase
LKSRTALLPVLLVAAVGGAAILEGQPAPTARPPLVVLSKSGRQALAVSLLNGAEMVSLADVAALLRLSVREDAAAGGLIIAQGPRTVLLSTTQGLASAGGKVLSLSAPPAKSGPAWFVPLDVVGRALPLVAETRIDLRRASRLLVLGDMAVPRVSARYESEAGRSRVILDIAPRTEHSVSQLTGRLVVSFKADALDADIPPPEPGDLLQGVRVVDPGTSIAVETGPRLASFRASDTPVDPASTRLVIELTGQGTPGLPTPAAPPPSPIRAAPEPPPVVFDQPTSAIRTIVLDPGHGGDETGAKGPAGTVEKDIALTVARQLKAVLEARLGVRVILTRDGDETVPLDERAAIANNNKADLFVSVHVNASVRGSVTGAEVFYLSLDDYGQEAAQLAEPGGEVLPSVTGGQRDVSLILWEMAQARHLENSAALAALIEQHLRARVPMSARAIQQAPFRVLVGANMPAVLVEIGFITNAPEEQKLLSPERQTDIVLALYESVVQFRAYLEGGRRAGAPAPALVAPARPAGPSRPGAGR